RERGLVESGRRERADRSGGLSAPPGGGTHELALRSNLRGAALGAFRGAPRAPAPARGPRLARPRRALAGAAAGRPPRGPRSRPPARRERRVLGRGRSAPSRRGSLWLALRRARRERERVARRDPRPGRGG